jgi:hypothetical protein
MVDICGNSKVCNVSKISEDVFVDNINGDRYNIEKVQCVWFNQYPMDNPLYVRKHLLKEKNG